MDLLENAPAVFIMAVILAFFVETLLEYLLGIWWKPLAAESRKKLVMAAGLLLGIGLAIGYKVDLMAELGFPPSIIGQVLSGAAMGRGSSYLHDLWKKITVHPNSP
ncbi:MAG: hypothetical protein PHE15_04995 [Dehalococcoidales bacterium]|nr:hypothetical protein [Dehalococcoidales bacterium]